MKTLKAQFEARFTIVRMVQNSLVLLDTETNETCYIHRNAYNTLLEGRAVDYRVTRGELSSIGDRNWIEVLVWRSL